MKSGRPHYLRERGKNQEQRVLESLASGSKTTKQLCQALGMKRASISIYLARLRDEPRRVYVCGHDPRHGRPAPIFAVGSKPDVEYVPQARPTPKISAGERRQQVLDLLIEKPRTARELGECMHIVAAAAGRYVAAHRTEESRRVYIIDWRHPSEVCRAGTGGDWAPVYAIGTKKDKPKPKRETSSQRNARLRKSPDFRESENARRRAYYAVQKHSKKKHGIFAALGL